MKLNHTLCLHLLFLFSNGMTMLLAKSYTTHSKIICENSSATITCPQSSGQFINVTYANYGRLTSKSCSKNGVTNCRASISYSVVRSKCDALNSCTLTASNYVFTDPCVGTFKYLEVKYTCMDGKEFPSMPKFPDAYVYNNKRPSTYVTSLPADPKTFIKQPYYYSIYNITKIKSTVPDDASIYDPALAFLHLSQNTPSRKEGAVCYPNIHDQASQFCIYRDSGHLYLSQTFVPAMYTGNSYNVSVLIRGSTVNPVIRKSSLIVSTVQNCFPMPELYTTIKSHCTSDAKELRYPTNLPWSGAKYGKKIPIATSSEITISRIFIHVDLLANFRESGSSSAKYEVEFFMSNNKRHERSFMYYSQSGQTGTANNMPQVSGNRLNFTVYPPITVASTEKFINVSLRLLSPRFRSNIVFNSENAIRLYGSNRIAACPGTKCIDAYRSWVYGISLLRFGSRDSCIVDTYLQEEYLKPCQSVHRLPKVEVPRTAEAGYIIYDLINQIDSGFLRPNLFRITNYTIDGQVYAGYSKKYFCDPTPFNDNRKFICLNRYKGLIRVRKSTASGFSGLPAGYTYSLEVQGENTVNTTEPIRVYVIDMTIVNATIVTTAGTTTKSLLSESEATTSKTVSTTTTKPVRGVTTTEAATKSKTTSSAATTIKAKPVRATATTVVKATATKVSVAKTTAQVTSFKMPMSKSSSPVVSVKPTRTVKSTTVAAINVKPVLITSILQRTTKLENPQKISSKISSTPIKTSSAVEKSSTKKSIITPGLSIITSSRQRMKTTTISPSPTMAFPRSTATTRARNNAAEVTSVRRILSKSSFRVLTTKRSRTMKSSSVAAINEKPVTSTLLERTTKLATPQTSSSVVSSKIKPSSIKLPFDEGKLSTKMSSQARSSSPQRLTKTLKTPLLPIRNTPTSTTKMLPATKISTRKMIETSTKTAMSKSSLSFVTLKPTTKISSALVIKVKPVSTTSIPVKRTARQESSSVASSTMKPVFIKSSSAVTKPSPIKSTYISKMTSSQRTTISHRQTTKKAVISSRTKILAKSKASFFRASSPIKPSSVFIKPSTKTSVYIPGTTPSSPATALSRPTTKITSPSPLPTTKMASPSPLPTTKIASPSPLPTTKMTSPSPLPTTKMASPSPLPTTKITSPSLLPTTKSPPSVAEFCKMVANCSQKHTLLHPINNTSEKTMLYYDLKHLLHTVRFRIWSVILKLPISSDRIIAQLYGLGDKHKISLANGTIALTNTTNALIFDTNLPNNCDRIALQLLNKTNNRNLVTDVMPVGSVTVSVATFEFCENNYCAQLNELWNTVHNGSSCPGYPFRRYKVCTESLLLFAPQSVVFYQPITLECKGQSGSLTQIKWFKDDVPLTVTTNVLSLNGQSYEDQGYYRCTAKSSGLLLTSREVLVQFKDVFSTTTYLEITNKIFTADLNDKQSSAYKELSNDVIKSVGTVLTDIPSKRPHDVSVEKFTSGSVIAQLKIYSNVLAQTSVESFHSNLKTVMKQAAVGDKFGSLKISSQSIITLNHEYCMPETTNKQASKGPYSWPMTALQRTAYVRCPNGPADSYATRMCSGNYSSGAVWQKVRDAECQYNNKRTEKLGSLSQTVVNESNAASVALELETLTTNATSLTSDDAVFASETFSNIVALNVTSDKVVDDLLNTASNLLQANGSVLGSSQSSDKALTTIVKGIESLADKIPLPNKTGQAVVKVASGVAIQAMKIDPLSVGTITFAIKQPSFSSANVISNQQYQVNDVAVGISLPETILSDLKSNSPNRLSFVAYKGGEFFQVTKKDALGQRFTDPTVTPNSMVMSAHVKGKQRVNLSQPLKGTFQKLSKSLVDKCVFWDFAANDGYGEWSSEGCRKVTEGSRVVCHCDHMTNFAILFDVYAGKQKSTDPVHEEVLGIISFIGIGLSLGGLFLTLLTLALFKRLRHSLPSKILIQLCLSLTLTLICFVIGADMTTPLHACRGFAIAIQYFLLVCFAWMVVEAVNLYLSFVVVMGTYISKFMIKASLCAWGLPAIIVGFTAWQRFEEYGNNNYCVVTGYAAYGTLFAPICLAIVINFVAFIMVFRALTNSARSKKITKDQKRSAFAQARIAATFSCILGLTWVFGLFAIADARIVFQYLFCIFNSLQGFTIFYFHVARQNEARNHWVHFLTGHGLNYYRSSLMSTSRGKSVRPPSTADRLSKIPADEKSATLTSNLSMNGKDDTLCLRGMDGSFQRLQSNASASSSNL